MARKRIRELDAQASITSTLKLAVDDTSLTSAKRIDISQLDARYGTFFQPCYLEWYQVTGSPVSPIASQGVFEALNVTAATVGVNSSKGLSVNAQGVVTYTGSAADFRVEVNSSLAGSNNDEVHIAIALNGNVQTKSEQSNVMRSGGKDSNIYSQCLLNLSSGNTLTVYVKNSTSNDSVTLGKINVIIEKIS